MGPLNRSSLIKNLEIPSNSWDIIVVGGGATGLGCALDATSRGFKTLLLEQSDFAKGTSSRSTKLIHGGVRYLRQGNLPLVFEALKERGLLMKNAPELVKRLSLIVPAYSHWDRPYYGIGLKFYDLMAGKYGIGSSRSLNKEQTLKYLPTLNPDKLRGGVLYHDGQFDDARLAITIAQSIVNLGGTALNYVHVDGLLKAQEKICGVVARDCESGQTYELKSKIVINATGVSSDAFSLQDDPSHLDRMTLSQGAHIVLDRSYLPGESALMVPKTSDGRVLFAIPWEDRVLVGTTDTPVDGYELDPMPFEEEIDFLLSHASQYLTKQPNTKDISSMFAGLRPLVGNQNSKKTSQINRGHVIDTSESGLITIMGGKWTTFRKMGEDVIAHSIKLAKLENRQSTSASIELQSPVNSLNVEDESSPIHARLSYTKGDVIRSIRYEMARTLEDVLARRTRALFLDARASIDMAEAVSSMITEELGQSETWRQQQITSYLKLAQGYFLD
jgi:glycerol-3-phosphate dehydrogenase